MARKEEFRLDYSMSYQIYFVSGLPRSGSTVMMNLLGQNPNHHVTPTSGLIELFIGVHNTWQTYLEFQSEGLGKVKPRIKKVMKGIINGYFEKEIKKEKVIFDKSRGWLQYIEDLENALGKKIRIIVPIRDIRSILASFEKLYRKRDIDWRYPVGDAFFQVQTTVDRCELLLQPAGVVGIAINRVRDAIQRVSDRLILVPYPSFMANPTGVMNTIHEILELEPFEYDPNKIKQVTREDDAWHGMDLHKVRPKIEPAQEIPWSGILPEDYAANVAKRFADIGNLCNPPQAAPPQQVVTPQLAK